MGKEKLSYEELLERAKACETMKDLSQEVGVSERVLRRRFQRHGTNFSSLKGKGLAAKPRRRFSAFLQDLRSGDSLAIALNRQFKELKIQRNKLLAQKAKGWQGEAEHLTHLIQEYEDLLLEW